MSGIGLFLAVLFEKPVGFVFWHGDGQVDPGELAALGGGLGRFTRFDLLHLVGRVIGTLRGHGNFCDAASSKAGPENRKTGMALLDKPVSFGLSEFCIRMQAPMA